MPLSPSRIFLRGRFCVAGKAINIFGGLGDHLVAAVSPAGFKSFLCKRDFRAGWLNGATGVSCGERVHQDSSCHEQ